MGEPQNSGEDTLVKFTIKRSLFLRFLDLTVFLLCIFLIFGILLKGPSEPGEHARLDATIQQVKNYEAAVATFRDKFGALPGDIPDAATKIPNCKKDCSPFAANASDGIIGNPDFAKTLIPQIDKTTVPAASAADETSLFWLHLLQTDLISGITDAGLTNGAILSWGVTNPSARLSGGFIVGYADGTPFPASLSPLNQGIKGIILVLVNSPGSDAKLNTSGLLPLSPSRAAQIDRKMDDGKPNSGIVQAYGASTCFKVDEEEKSVKYNEENYRKDCGLIFKIADTEVKKPQSAP